MFLSIPGEDGASDTTSCLYFQVPDIHHAHQELTRRGVRFEGAPHMIFRDPPGTEEWMAFFDDPDGQPNGIMTQVAPQ